MIIKSFTAESASAALKLVRREMGGDAIVLKTVQREDAVPENQVEITACLDQPTVSQSSTLLTDSRVSGFYATDADDSEDRSQALGGRLAAMEEKLNRLVIRAAEYAGPATADHAPQIDALRFRLIESDFPLGFVDSLIDEIDRTLQTVGEFEHVAHHALLQRLSELMAPGLEVQPGDRLVFVGPAGMGKSSVMAKLAAQLTATEGQRVRLVSPKSDKLMGYDEVASSTITMFDSDALPGDREQIRLMAGRLERIKPTHCVMVFSSLARASSVARLATAIAPLRPTHLAMTMLDMADCYGPAIAAAMATNLKISLVTDTPGDVGVTFAPDPESVTRGLLSNGGGDV